MERANSTTAQAGIAVSPPAPAKWALSAPLIGVFALALLVPLVGNDYWVLIATRAAIYWVLVAGLNLMIGFAGQLAIGYVALLTLGAYTTSVLAAGNVLPAINPFLALVAAGCAGAIFGVIVGLPALRLRTFYFAMTTLGFATKVVSVTVLIFFMLISFVFWLAGLAGKKDWEPKDAGEAARAAHATEVA